MDGSVHNCNDASREGSTEPVRRRPHAIGQTDRELLPCILHSTPTAQRYRTGPKVAIHSGHFANPLITKKKTKRQLYPFSLSESD